MEHRGREGLTLKGTGHSEGEGPALYYEMLPPTDLLDVDEVMLFPNLNIHNGMFSAGWSQNYCIHILVPPLLILKWGKSSFSLIRLFYKLSGIMDVNTNTFLPDPK